jgi:hypothetical protein
MKLYDAGQVQRCPHAGRTVETDLTRRPGQIMRMISGTTLAGGTISRERISPTARVSSTACTPPARTSLTPDRFLEAVAAHALFKQLVLASMVVCTHELHNPTMQYLIVSPGRKFASGACGRGGHRTRGRDPRRSAGQASRSAHPTAGPCPAWGGAWSGSSWRAVDCYSMHPIVAMAPVVPGVG